MSQSPIRPDVEVEIEVSPRKGECPLQALLRAENSRLLRRALGRIDPIAARVIRLRFGLEDGREWGESEIAEVLGCKPYQVSDWVAVGLIGLERLLRKDSD